MAQYLLLGKRLVNPIQTVNLIGLHPTSRGSADPLETAADELPVKSGYTRACLIVNPPMTIVVTNQPMNPMNHIIPPTASMAVVESRPGSPAGITPPIKSNSPNNPVNAPNMMFRFFCLTIAIPSNNMDAPIKEKELCAIPSEMA